MGLNPLLKIDNLNIELHGDHMESLPVVRDISLCLKESETLCLVGESGCGKTVTALSILRLLPSPPFQISGKILWKGRNLLEMNINEIEKLRGKEISIIFQEPLSSFNPVERIGEQILEVVEIHTYLDEKSAKELVYETMKNVGFKSPEIQYELYPHELSGGMRQRAMIAMAIILKPSLIIADEPTTSLDVTIQAQILNLIQKLKEEYGVSLIFITHNLGIVASIAQNVAVIYAGRIVEYGSVTEIFKNPNHPYTSGLLSSVPSLSRKMEIKSIPGLPPEINNIPKGCAFHPRCRYRMKECEDSLPPFLEVDEGHFVSCWLFKNQSFRSS